MRHYEIVFLVHPNQSDQVPKMIEKYQSLVKKTNGSTHRVEDWGRRDLAFSINNLNKAHYVLMNVECDLPAISEIENLFRFNDSVIRNLIIKTDKAETGESYILQAEKLKQAQQLDTRKAERRTADKPTKETTPTETEQGTPIKDSLATESEEKVEESQPSITTEVKEDEGQ